MQGNNEQVDFLIMGAGLAGLGAGVQAKRRGHTSLILETEDSPGGLCQNTRVHGCDFDFGPKILIFKSGERDDDLLGFLKDNVQSYPMAENTYLSRFGLVGFPLQRYLIDVPIKERHKILESLQEVRQTPIRIQSYKDWLINSYGRYFCETILIPYEEKKWQMSLDDLDYYWALHRPVKVDIDEVVAGSQRRLLPNRTYYYPKVGNISALSEALAKEAGPIVFNSRVTAINMTDKFVVANGKKYFYKHLVSSIPLDQAVAMTAGLNRELKEASQKMLNWLSIRVFNLVFEGNFDLQGSAIYFPEKSFVFRRVSVLQNLCPALARSGLTPISVEISLHPNKQTPTEKEHLDQLLKDLQKVPQFAALGKPIAHQMLAIPCAYPLQRNGMREQVETLHAYYQKFDIYHCGRGGNFDYCNSDVAYNQGKEVIDTVLKKTIS